jgi:hypothetical protein
VKDKEKGPKSKRPATTSTSADWNDCESDDNASKAPCKKKKHTSVEEAYEEEEETMKIQVYLNVETPPLPVVRVGSHPVKQPPPKIT